MSVLPAAEMSGAVNRAIRRKTWQRFARAMDVNFVDRSGQAVPATVLPRSKHGIDRCRQLMHKGSAMAVGASDLTRF
jgi:hypothetical protein